jgi:HEPN domain-containing protein
VRLNAEHGFPEVACFLAQQSAEKALEAFLYARGQGPVLGHSTLALCNEAAGFERAFAALADACRRLDQLYIPTRYPNGLPAGIPHGFFTREQADGALRDLGAVLAVVEGFVAI